MIYHANEGQTFYGHSIGILMLDTFVPMIPGDIGNATTFYYPVLYRTLKGISTTTILKKDPKVLKELITKGRELIADGAKAITSNCGFLLSYQDELRKELNVPIFLSSLMQLPFSLSMLNQDEKIGIVTADSTALDLRMLQAVGLTDPTRVTIHGLEQQSHFYRSCLAEVGTLDPEKIRQEVVDVTEEMVRKDPKIKTILLECSFLTPYSQAVQEVVQLPVFDYKTMIDYVQSTYSH